MAIGAVIGGYCADKANEELNEAKQDEKSQENNATESSPKPKVNGHQGKHIPNHNDFDKERGRSELTHPDPQALLDKYAGTGTREGEGQREYIEADEVIGIYVNKKTGERKETKRGTIHYDESGGAHIVPAPAEAPSDGTKKDSPGNTAKPDSNTDNSGS